MFSHISDDNLLKKMSSAKLAPENRGPTTSLRAHATPKQPLVECEQCYHQHNNHHPCLFCTRCLKTTRNKPKNTVTVSNRNGYYGSKTSLNGSDPDGGGQDPLKSGKPDYTEFWNTFMEIKTQKQRVRTGNDERVTEQRLSIMKQKAKKLEIRATRCGFCPQGAKRTGLVSYCVHCKKHLCQICHTAHTKDPLFKHHGSVDLSKDKNSALL